ncbi:hypothetical protein L6R53_02050 [Myxococcota bacterium]|nr:hypothetical protein [Myxococcota bacterium]
MTAACALAGRCGGCPWIDRPLEAQRAHRVEALRRAWQQAGLDPAALAALPLHPAGDLGLRDRADLSLRRDGAALTIGLRSLDGAELVDLPTCPVQSPALAAAYAHLRADPPPLLTRAGLRLRVGPQGQRGLWLDAANAELKALLDEGAWLSRLLDQGVVLEAGQKHKRVLPGEAGRPRLGRPEVAPWSLTRLGAGTTPVFTAVSGFTQPGMAANLVLVDAVRGAARASGARRWLELGAGAGNLTLMLAGEGWQVAAVELDPVARQGLLAGARAAGCEDRIRLARGNLQRVDEALAAEAAQAEGLLVDPPRSGLGALVPTLALLPADRLPPAIVHVSCWTESFAADTARLLDLGYLLERIEGVDQFPHTPQAEWVALLRRG